MSKDTSVKGSAAYCHSLGAKTGFELGKTAQPDQWTCYIDVPLGGIPDGQWRITGISPVSTVAGSAKYCHARESVTGFERGIMTQPEQWTCYAQHEPSVKPDFTIEELMGVRMSWAEFQAERQKLIDAGVITPAEAPPISDDTRLAIEKGLNVVVERQCQTIRWGGFDRRDAEAYFETQRPRYQEKGDIVSWDITKALQAGGKTYWDLKVCWLVVTPAAPIVYATVERAPFSFPAYNETEKVLLEDFLGIKPEGLMIDLYLTNLTKTGLEEWKVYWDQQWSRVGRGDMLTFTQEKYDFFLPTKKEEPPEPPTPPPEPVYTYKILPPPPSQLHDEGITLYQQLDKFIFEGSIDGIMEVLRKMAVTEQSPATVLAIIMAVSGIVGILITVIGSYPFAKFLLEEALQTLDFAIYTARENGDWEGMAKAIAKKDELLQVTGWEKVWAAIPFANTLQAAQEYFEASKVKQEVDKRDLDKKLKEAGFNPNVDLDKAVEAIEKGEDPTPYLPSTQKATLAEQISGSVTGVVDGDTIDVRDIDGFVYKVRLIGIDAPEGNTIAGKDSTKYLTDRVWGKQVSLFIDKTNQYDKYGRVLAVVKLNGIDVNKELISEGKANYYFMGSSKWFNEQDYMGAAKRYGKVKVYSKPTYCKIYIDGVDTGKIAIETFDLEVGTYIVGCSKEGYRAETQTVEIKEGETIEVRFELTATGLGDEEKPPTPPTEEPPEFKIEITSSPSNAKLYIDGVYTHHLTPSNERELSDVMNLLTIGSHTLKVTKAGEEATKTVTIVEGDNGAIHLELEPIGLPPPEEPPPEVIPPTAPPKEFKISIISTPSNAKLYIDNVYTHHLTPSNERELSDVMHLLGLGKHTIKVTKAGMMAEREVTIVEGDNGLIDLTLQVVGLPPPEEIPPTTLEERIAELERNVSLILEKLK